MARIDEGMVLKRAKARAEQDGFAWYLDAKQDSRPLSEARRRLYLAKARVELSGEAADA
jgi:hypothetical protein